MRSRCLTALAALCLGLAPSHALVEPKVEGWEAAVEAARQLCTAPGSDLIPEALEEFGALSSALVDAPLHDLMVELEERRNLKFLYFTPWHVKDRDQLRAWLKEQLAKEYPPSKVAEEEAKLKALGLVPDSFRLVPFMEELFTSQVAGVYDPVKDQFFLVDTTAGLNFRQRATSWATQGLMARAGLAAGDQVAIVTIHELDHALGGQHFPVLKRFGEGLKDMSTDQQMAVQALIEGDASFVMFDHQYKTPPKEMGEKTYVDAALMVKLVGMMVTFPIPLPGTAEVSNAPLYFQKGLMFPYLNGAGFVSAMRHVTEDWAAVDSAYGMLPSSTEQILHPESYLYVSTPPSTPDLSGLPKSVGAWKTVAEDSGGEFLVRIVLEQNRVSDFVSAAEGWNGDRFRVYKHASTGKLAFLWALRWDSDQDAEEFVAAASTLPFRLESDRGTTYLSNGFDPVTLEGLRGKVR